MPTDVARVLISADDRTGTAFTSARRGLESIQAQARRTSEVVRELGGRFDRFSMAASSIRAGGALGGLAGFAFFSQAAAEAAQAERNINVLNATLRSTGNAAGLTRNDITGLADELAGISRFDDDDLVAGMTTMLRFKGIAGDTFKVAAKAAVDLAAATGSDLSSAFERVSRALADPAAGLRGLKEAGVVLNEEQRKLIETLSASGRTAQSSALVLNELQRAIGGAAAAENQGITGATSRLGKAWRGMLEEIGNDGAFRAAVSGLASLIEALNAAEAASRTARLVDRFTPADLDRARVDQAQAENARRRADIESLISGHAAFGKEVASIQAAFDKITAARDDISRKGALAELERLLPVVRAHKDFADAVDLGNARLTERGRLAAQLSTKLEAFARAEADFEGLSGPPLESFMLSMLNKFAPSIKEKIDDTFTLHAEESAARFLDGLRDGLHAARGEGDTFFATLSKIAAALPGSQQVGFYAEAQRLRDRTQIAQTELDLQAAVERGAQRQLQLRSDAITAYEREIDAMQRELALGANATEYEKIKYELERGRFQLLDSSYGDYLKSLSLEVDHNRELVKIERDRQRAADDARRKREDEARHVQGLVDATPSAQRQRILRDIDLVKGAIGSADWSNQIPGGIKQYNEVLDGLQKQLNNVGRTGADTFQELESAIRSWQAKSTDAIVDFAFGATTDFRSMVNEILRDLARLAVSKYVTKPLFDSFSSLLDSGGGGSDIFSQFGSMIFGGGRASGGDVQPGRYYKVGEVGPEYFVPRTAGSIVPSGKMGAISTTINVSVNNSGGGQSSTSSTSEQKAHSLSRALEQGVRDVLVKEMRSGGLLAATR